MLKLKRPALPPKKGKAKSPQQDLNDRQAAVDRAYDPKDPDAGKVIHKHWGNFKSLDTSRATNGKPSVKATLGMMSHEKCAYCECSAWKDIEHHWPKTPADENARKGTPARMFQWSNLLPACGICNEAGYKGSNMEWVGVGKATRTKLLDPSAPGDDPYCHFTIRRVEAPPLLLGWIDPRPGLTKEANERASYTITRLGLNTREAPWQGRRQTLSRFSELCRAILDGTLGPDAKLDTGLTVRQVWVEFLSAKRPYLAPLRQIFHESPELRAALVQQMPEIDAVIAEWDLPPDDCAQVRQLIASQGS